MIKQFQDRALLAAHALWMSLLMSSAAQAQVRDLGEIADDLTTQVSQLSTLVSVVSFVLGVAIAIAGLMKFRAHSQNPKRPIQQDFHRFRADFCRCRAGGDPLRSWVWCRDHFWRRRPGDGWQQRLQGGPIMQMPAGGRH